MQNDPNNFSDKTFEFRIPSRFCMTILTVCQTVITVFDRVSTNSTFKNQKATRHNSFYISSKLELAEWKQWDSQNCGPFKICGQSKNCGQNKNCGLDFGPQILLCPQFLIRTTVLTFRLRMK